jgi:hypothetical protein
MQFGSSIDNFPCFTRLNPCVAPCSTDSIPWVHHSREEGSLDYNGGFVRLQIHMNFDTIIYRQHFGSSVDLAHTRPYAGPAELLRWKGTWDACAGAPACPHTLRPRVRRTGEREGRRRRLVPALGAAAHVRRGCHRLHR